MARKVVWSEPAWHDLEQVADYIAQDSLHYAAAFVREVRDAARSLATFAERGRVVPELNDPAVRELLVEISPNVPSDGSNGPSRRLRARRARFPRTSKRRLTRSR